MIVIMVQGRVYTAGPGRIVDKANSVDVIAIDMRLDEQRLL
jgi:hypothetical protein